MRLYEEVPRELRNEDSQDKPRFSVFSLLPAPLSRRGNVKQAWASEWDNYRLTPRVDGEDDPLMWWKTHETQFPTLGLF